MAHLVEHVTVLVSSRLWPLTSPEYDELLEDPVPQSEYCTERFTPHYLDDFRTHAIQYCATGSAALHCFQGQSRPNGEIDSICIGQSATLDVGRKQFALDCELRDPNTTETDRGLIPFDEIRGEWYDSGPRFTFDHFIHIGRDSSSAPAPTTPPSAPHNTLKFALLAKRESNSNIWHCLMEIMTMTMSFDLLRTTADPSREGGPFFDDREDVPNTEVIVVDDLTDGLLLDLWALVTGRPPIRLKDILEDKEKAQTFAEVPRSIIVPIAGAANPIWQNDWDNHDCGHAPMLRAFSHRVLGFYGIPTPALIPDASHSSSSPAPVNLTYINRTDKRRLVDDEALLAAVEAKYPHVRVRSVDFSAISFVEQLLLVRETDILLGVHGAGFAHTMFMRNDHGAVVEIRPATNDYRGFRNLSVMKGLHYLTAYGAQVPVGKHPGKRGAGAATLAKRASWHFDDVKMEKEEFMKLMDDAIAAVS
ncbi:DUF563 domain-containing protein [Dichotomopilus funicola]|uniref:EGF domain-specific O-linked N-acetylglucosamine transferase n=1 Tax=Dichotomopilus funicola TaxID=1934379 RepID=A0AAN6ZQ36_9PEZI|nr:DUF563 domain-containing protein [Dichotomopilus funicola]